MIVLERSRLAFHFPERRIKAQLLSESVTSGHSTCGFYYHALELCTSLSLLTLGASEHDGLLAGFWAVPNSTQKAHRQDDNNGAEV